MLPPSDFQNLQFDFQNRKNHFQNLQFEFQNLQKVSKFTKFAALGAGYALKKKHDM